jgi:hypothetical protein
MFLIYDNITTHTGYVPNVFTLPRLQLNRLNFRERPQTFPSVRLLKQLGYTAYSEFVEVNVLCN